VDKNDDDMLWNDSEEDGNVKSRKTKAVNVKIGVRILIGKGKYNLTCSMY
jgi:hypothetical protein